MPLSPLHKGTIASAPSPLLFRALRVTCLRVVLGRYQRRSLTLFASVQAYVAEVIRYTIVFADEDIFEPEHHLFEQEREELDLELHIISNINQEITRNPLFYPALIREFGYDAVVPRTDITFRAFAAQHQGA